LLYTGGQLGVLEFFKELYAIVDEIVGLFEQVTDREIEQQLSQLIGHV